MADEFDFSPTAPAPEIPEVEVEPTPSPQEEPVQETQADVDGVESAVPLVRLSIVEDSEIDYPLTLTVANPGEGYEDGYVFEDADTTFDVDPKVAEQADAVGVIAAAVVDPEEAE